MLLNNINVEEENQFFSSLDGVVYKKNGEELFLYPVGRSGDVIIKEGVRQINSYAFSNCNKITNVVLSSSVKSLLSSAFYFCENLKSITLSSSIHYIDFGTFLKCNSLSCIKVPEDNPYIKNIDGVLYYSDGNIVYIPNDSKDKTITLSPSVTFIKINTFRNTIIDTLIIPQELDFNDIKERDDLYFYKNIKRIIFQKKDTKVNELWFCKHDRFGNIKEEDLDYFITLASGLYPKQIYDEYLDYFIDNVSFHIINDTTVEEYWKKEWLTYLKDKCKTLYHKIANNENLLKVMIHYSFLDLEDTKNVLQILQDKNDVSLIALLLEYQNKRFTFEEIINSKTTELTQDTSSVSFIKTIYDYEIKNDEVLIKSYKGKESIIYVPQFIEDLPVTSIESFAFSPIEKGITKDDKEYRKHINNIILPNTVKHISSSSFHCCKNLTNISFPDNILKIECGNEEKGYFYGCDSLKSFILPENVSVIEKGSFSYSSFREIKLSDNLKKIDDNAFSFCTKLSYITLAHTLEEIGSNAFSNCINIQSIVIPENVKKIGKGCFSYCQNLISVTILNKECDFGRDCFIKNGHLVIKAYKGSSAIEYALKNQIRYEYL